MVWRGLAELLILARCRQIQGAGGVSGSPVPRVVGDQRQLAGSGKQRLPDRGEAVERGRELAGPGASLGG